MHRLQLVLRLSFFSFLFPMGLCLLEYRNKQLVSSRHIPQRYSIELSRITSSAHVRSLELVRPRHRAAHHLLDYPKGRTPSPAHSQGTPTPAPADAPRSHRRHYRPRARARATTHQLLSRPRRPRRAARATRWRRRSTPLLRVRRRRRARRAAARAWRARRPRRARARRTLRRRRAVQARWRPRVTRAVASGAVAWRTCTAHRRAMREKWGGVGGCLFEWVGGGGADEELRGSRRRGALSPRIERVAAATAAAALSAADAAALTGLSLADCHMHALGPIRPAPSAGHSTHLVRPRQQ